MKQFIVDAFTDTLFKGNQAAVCVMDKWIPDELMQNIAAENRFSETAFTVKEGRIYHLRWFTPGGEIDFCGHATLGTSYVLLTFYEKEAEEIDFKTQVGILKVQRDVSFHSKCKVWEQRPDTVRQFKEPCQCGVPRIFQGAA